MDDDDDLPLEADDLLIQQYLDGTLDEEAMLQAEFRIDEDPDFARRIAGYSSMFAALDREGALRSPAPLGIAEAAVAAWAPTVRANEAPATSFADLFGSVGWAASVFVAADVLLAGLIVGLMVEQGPVTVFKSWVLGLKDLGLYLASVAPGPDQIAVLLPAVTLASLFALGGVWTAGRRVYARTEHLR